MFPCGHAFHSHCLLENIRPHLSPDQQAAVASLVALIAQGGDGEGKALSAPRGAAAAAAAAAAAGGGGGMGGLGQGGGGGGGGNGSKRAQHYLRSLQVNRYASVAQI